MIVRKFKKIRTLTLRMLTQQWRSLVASQWFLQCGEQSVNAGQASERLEETTIHLPAMIAQRKKFKLISSSSFCLE